MLVGLTTTKRFAALDAAAIVLAKPAAFLMKALILIFNGLAKQRNAEAVDIEQLGPGVGTRKGPD